MKIEGSRDKAGHEAVSFTLEQVVESLPGSVYWKDRGGAYLGCNNEMLKMVGLSRAEVIGKTDYDLAKKLGWSDEIVDAFTRVDQEVIKSGIPKLNFEEIPFKIASGKLIHQLANKVPLRNARNEIIGVLGISVDLTQHKHLQEKLLKDKEKAENESKHVKLNLEQIVASMPGSIYWKDHNGVYLGCNDELVKLLGLPKKDIIGKTDYDFVQKLGWSDEVIKSFTDLDKAVMFSGIPRFNFEEPLSKFAGGKQIYQLSNKVPLKDENDNIVGIIGISIDITDRKKAEAEATQLKVENAEHKAQLEANAQFTKLANQVVHDIRSPLASLMIIVKHCRDLPEAERIALREAARGIGDIANNLLNQYQVEKTESVIHHEERKPVLLSAMILQLLTDKRFQYKDLSVQFEDQISRSGQFAFIQMQPSAFKRMLSNLINNAVDAFDNKTGVVTVKLDVSAELVKVIVEDNGKGMPLDIIDKIMQNIAFTAGKSDGHGIGLTQVRDTLQANEGKMSIQSTIGKGTQIILDFPQIQTPGWIAEEISLCDNDKIVILDDDSSIHSAWDTRFESILKRAPEITVKHFEICHDALDFIGQFSEDEKQKIYLLTDYELLKQELNGLNVVERSGVKRSILVTSHYADPIVLDLAGKMGTKILPKQLASEIPIYIDSKYVRGMREVDVVIIEGDQKVAEQLLVFLREVKNKKVDYFNNLDEFEKNISHYSKNTSMYLDSFRLLDIDRGVEMAKKLHRLGYERLYLFSGYNFSSESLPNYLTFIRKDDITGLEESFYQ